MDLHNKEITGLHWDEEKKMILTTSMDKSIKLYQFPMYWPCEMIRKSIRNKNILKLKDESGKKLFDLILMFEK